MLRTIVAAVLGVVVAMAGGVKLFAPAMLAGDIASLWTSVWNDKLPFLGSAQNLQLLIGVAELLAGVVLVVGPVTIQRVAALCLAVGPLGCAVYSHVVMGDAKWQPAAVLTGLAVVVAIWPGASADKSKTS